MLATLLWSTAGWATRHLKSTQSFEVTFWRSLFTAMALGVFTLSTTGWRLGSLFWQGGWPLMILGLMWGLMFTCFMLALTLTTVENVLITISLSPLITAILASERLGHKISKRTWAVIWAAGAGVASITKQGHVASRRDHRLGLHTGISFFSDAS